MSEKCRYPLCDGERHQYFDSNAAQWNEPCPFAPVGSPTTTSGITDDEIESKWAELNAEDGDIRIMAMLHELLQLRRK